MRRAILHIGMPRTGSTSLQAVLTELRPRLAEAGVLYPDLAPPGGAGPADVNHQRLGEVLDGRRPAAERRPTLDRLAAALAGTQADTLVLSFEDFSVQHPRFGAPETLRALLARHGFAMEVLIGVKSPFAFLNSAYAHRAQLVREHRSFRSYAGTHRRDARLDYARLVEPWARAATRVAGVPLRDARSRAPLVRRLLDAADLMGRLAPVLGAQACETAINRSSGPIAVEASRRLRRMGVHRQFRGHPREIGHAIDAAAWSRGLDGESFRGAAPTVERAVAEHTAASRERFARLVWGASWDAVVAPDPARAPNEWAGRAIPDEVEAAIAAIVAETIARLGFRPLPAWRVRPRGVVADWIEALAETGLLARRWRVS